MSGRSKGSIAARIASASLKRCGATAGTRSAASFWDAVPMRRKVAGWLETAASVPGFIGFAVGRTTFWDAVADYEAQKTSKQEAASRVAQRYREWVAIFERAHASHTGAL